MKKLEGYGVKGILRQLAENGQIIDVRCEMPQCYCPEGRRHFDPISEGTKWSPTADHYPTLKSKGGHLTPDNVRLAHRFCNQRDFIWRAKINAMLGKRMSLDEIAAELNAQNVPTIHGANEWKAPRPFERHSSPNASRPLRPGRLVQYLVGDADDVVSHRATLHAWVVRSSAKIVGCRARSVLSDSWWRRLGIGFGRTV